MTIAGIDLLRLVAEDKDVPVSLNAVLLEHITTGRSVDEILHLKANGDGSRTPRVRVLLELRGAALLKAWRYIRDAYDISDRRACFELYSMVKGKDETPEELEEAVSEIRIYSSLLNIELSSPESLYKAIINLNCAINPSATDSNRRLFGVESKE